MSSVFKDSFATSATAIAWNMIGQDCLFQSETHTPSYVPNTAKRPENVDKFVPKALTFG